MLAAALIAATNAGASQLDTYRETYEREVQKIRDAHATSLGSLSNSYAKSLDVAIDTLRREGDPDAVVTAMAEKVRFERDRTIPSTPADDLPRLLQDLQAKYNETVKAVGIAKAKRFTDLTNRYIVALNRLMRILTNESNLEEALLVKNEMERVEFVVADIESKLKGIADRKAVEKAKQEEETRLARLRMRLPKEARDAVEWNGHFYKFFAVKGLSWRDALRRCEVMGGTLVQFETEQEAAFVTSIVDNGYTHVGGYYSHKDRRWYWTDNTAITFFQWRHDQPNQLDISPTLAINAQGEWYDMKRGEPRIVGFVCEWK